MSLILRTTRGAGRTQNEISGLRHALDRAYARIRERARVEWERHAISDPSDSCVSVRVERGPRRLTV